MVQIIILLTSSKKVVKENKQQTASDTGDKDTRAKD